MSTDTQLSTNARKLQDDEIERLVKCRLRSEIEARKAVESTMKRAVLEARELKKELVLLRQEKDELRTELHARKHAVSAPSESKRGSNNNISNNDDSATVAAAAKATEKKLMQQLERLAAENTELRHQYTQLETDAAARERTSTTQLEAALQQREQREQRIEALEDDAKKLRLASDETKRKCQRLVADKREALALSLQENAQLAKCKATLEQQLALLPQLRKQLQHAKDKSASAVDDAHQRLETREQAFVRQAEADAARIVEFEQRTAALESERLQLRAELDALTSDVYERDQMHGAMQRKQIAKCEQLVAAVQALEDELSSVKSALETAEQARVVADETRAQETKLRQLADDAADAVEARSRKVAAELEAATQQLAQLERALQTRGITFDFLLKAPAAGSSSNSNSKERLAEKQRERPETPTAAPPTKRDTRAANTSSSAATTGVRRPVSSAKTTREPAAPLTKTAAKAVPARLLTTKLALSQAAPPGVATAVKPRSTAAASAANTAAKRVPLSHRTSVSKSSNNNDTERDSTPERTRRR